MIVAPSAIDIRIIRTYRVHRDENFVVTYLRCRYINVFQYVGTPKLRKRECFHRIPAIAPGTSLKRTSPDELNETLARLVEDHFTGIQKNYMRQARRNSTVVLSKW